MKKVMSLIIFLITTLSFGQTANITINQTKRKTYDEFVNFLRTEYNSKETIIELNEFIKQVEENTKSKTTTPQKNIIEALSQSDYEYEILMRDGYVYIIIYQAPISKHNLNDSNFGKQNVKINISLNNNDYHTRFIQILKAVKKYNNTDKCNIESTDTGYELQIVSRQKIKTETQKPVIDFLIDNGYSLNLESENYNWANIVIKINDFDSTNKTIFYKKEIIISKQQELESLKTTRALLRSCEVNVSILQKIQNKNTNKFGYFIPKLVNSSDKVIYNKNLNTLKIKIAKVSPMFDAIAWLFSSEETGFMMALNGWNNVYSL